MVACASSPGRLFAAPFAVVGSIGVIGQAVNIHKTLKGWGVEPLVFRGGRDKAPVGLVGEITKEGVAKVQEMVDKTHTAFKRHVVGARPVLASRIDEIATGDVWLGYDALDVGLVDRLVTSDEVRSIYGGSVFHSTSQFYPAPVSAASLSLTFYREQLPLKYVGERVADGARVLKLVQIRKPKYPFSRPSTTGDLHFLEKMRECVPTRTGLEVELHKLSHRLSEFLKVFTSLLDENQGFSSVARAATASSCAAGLSASNTVSAS